LRANILQAAHYVPIDIPAVAATLGVEKESLFGRLYGHLDPKYRKESIRLFSPVVGSEQNSVNFPLLEAVLAGLSQERRRDRQAFVIAVISLTIAVASFFVSLFG
jgi:hypothetical protein